MNLQYKGTGALLRLDDQLTPEGEAFFSKHQDRTDLQFKVVLPQSLETVDSSQVARVHARMASIQQDIDRLRRTRESDPIVQRGLRLLEKLRTERV